MIAALVTFKIDGAISLDEAVNKFNTTAPNYRGKAGLISKAYIYREDGGVLGGFYLWESREQAEAQYSEAWQAKATEIYGVAPEFQYFEAPVFIQNQVPAEILDD
jgi:hypothetical protein